MDEEKIALHIDLERNLLRITCAGFWTIGDVQEYYRRQQASLREMAAQGCPVNEALLLIDTTKQGPQALEVITELGKVVSLGAADTKKVAVLVSSALLARQSARTGSEHRVFYDEQGAMDWLLSA